MKYQFFARYANSEGEVAAFATEQERDLWVAYRDIFSLSTFTMEDAANMPRIAIDAEEAARCTNGNSREPSAYLRDGFVGNIRWIFPWYAGKTNSKVNVA